VVHFARADSQALFIAGFRKILCASGSASIGPNQMAMKQRELYTSRYFRNGASYVAVIPPDLRELMGLVPGDTLAMNFQHGVLWVVKLKPEMVIDRITVSRIFDELFKSKEDALASK
jgi:bifunctional DNA-binding transcriptional regulator/antitoxin component of YhaV-PrlF toxin-antitoxin module